MKFASTKDMDSRLLPPSHSYHRSVFQQIRDKHSIHKSRYEELQQQLFDENKSLEERFLQMQKECEERESLYKLLTTTESITASTLLEQKLEEGAPEEEKPSFPTTNLSQMYQDKFDQLQQLQLSKKHQDKKGGDYNSKQDAMFKSLKKLLEMKQRSLFAEKH